MFTFDLQLFAHKKGVSSTRNAVSYTHLEYTDDAIVSIAENLDFLPASQSARWEDIGRKKYKKLVRRLCDVYDYILICLLYTSRCV